MLNLSKTIWSTSTHLLRWSWRQCNQRFITSSEIATALRPFYFAVHPDLFGQYPAERTVNENSLKHLSEHLALLQSKKRHIPPFNVQFFLKDTRQSSKKGRLQLVQISLGNQSVHDTVHTVLQCCRLPVDYINSLAPSSVAKPDRPIQWDPSFYARYNKVNPHAKLKKRGQDESLSSWLGQKIEEARNKQRALEPVQKEIHRLQCVLYEKTQLKEVVWDSRWALPQFRACLRSLLRLYKEHGSQLDLAGYTVVFGNETGFSCQGNIILKVNDVAENWLHLLHSVRKQDIYLHKLPSTEGYLSTLLNDIQIVTCRNGPTMLAAEYLNQLRKLISAIKRYRASDIQHEWIDRCMKDVQLVVECAVGPLMLSEEGHIVVPSSCPIFLMVDFLQQHSDEARHKRVEYCRKKMCQDESAQECCNMLGLASLTRDGSVSADQMEACCQCFLAHRGDFAGINLRGCRVKVSQFSSVMSDGEIYVPWNWKTIDSVT